MNHSHEPPPDTIAVQHHQQPKLLYGLDDRPPPLRTLILALQHVLTMFGSTVAVPLLFGPMLWPIPNNVSEQIASQLQEMRLTNIALLISSVMLCSGVATLLQSTFGSRLPIIQGVSFSFIAGFTAIVASVQSTTAPDWNTLATGASPADLVNQWQTAGASGMRAIAGAIILGAMFEILVGFSGVMGVVRRYLSPVVVGPVIMLIGLALYTVGATTAASHWPIALLTMSGIIICSLILSKHFRWFQLFPMLSAIMISMIVCGIGTGLGAFAPGSAAYVDLRAVEKSDWIRVTSIIFPWGLPTFSITAGITILAAYLASIIESFGDYHACKNIAGGGDPTPQEISRGIGMEGIACVCTGIFGGFSSTSYSENIGLVGLTRVGSRFVVQVSGVILIFLGIVGKFGACAAAIPKSVVGGLYCVLFGLIAAVGVRQFSKANLNSDRNLLIGGFAMFMGLSVPFYFNQGSGKADISWLPELSQNLLLAVCSTGMAVAAIIGLLLDNLIAGTSEERGLRE